MQYIEDDLRKQFFRDHPFEAFRPRTLVEGMGIEPPHSVSGKAWKRWCQRGRNLHVRRKSTFLFTSRAIIEFLRVQILWLFLSEAYLCVVAQFHGLRYEHHLATAYAIHEGETFGSTFASSEIQKTFEKEKGVLGAWKQEEQPDERVLMTKRRWRAIIERDTGEGKWTKGQGVWSQLGESITETSATTVLPSSTLVFEDVQVQPPWTVTRCTCEVKTERYKMIDSSYGSSMYALGESQVEKWI